MKRYILIRDVPTTECDWLNRDMKKGETVYRFYGATYGAIGGDGVAVTLEPDKHPFFELPENALKEVA